MTTTKTVDEVQTGTTRQISDLADSVAGAAGDMTARIPEVAQGTRDAIAEANRMVRGGSDQTLKLVGAGAVGFAVGLLMGGANRMLVVLSLVPASLIAATLMQRVDENGATKSAARLQGRSPARALIRHGRDRETRRNASRPTVDPSLAAASQPEEATMDDVKKGYRETEETTKETWRKSDGEDLADKVGNAGDDIRKGLGDAGDKIREGVDDTGDQVDTEFDRRQPANTGNDRV